MPLFSILTPVHLYDEKRSQDFERCLASVQTQTDQDFEHIIINDGSTVDLPPLTSYSKTKVIHQEHMERVYALRAGLEKTTGEWMCFLDSDDIYFPHYLETVREMIAEYPEAKMFNFGSVHIHADKRVVVRDPFEPKWLEEEGRHEVFGGGTIVHGTFVFHRSLWEKLGDFPTTTEKLWNPWDFSDAAQLEFPEIKPLFTVDHPDHPEGLSKELGNPFGQDYYLFYKYTRKFRSIPVKKHLYVVYHK